jgi:spore coat protein SA
MRILFLYMFPLWGNGSGSYLRGLTKELVARGHTIGIVAPDKRKLPGIKHYVVSQDAVGVFAGHPELPKAKRFEDMNGKELGKIYEIYLKSTIDAVSDFNPEIVHVFHTAFLPGIARIIKILFGIKFIITTHGSDLSYLSCDRRLIGLINDANKVARFITANSDFTKKWYLDMFGYNLRNKSSVIMGGVDLEDYKRNPKHIELIDKKYRLKDKKVVLFTGRLTKNKGVIYLVRAAASIKGTVLIVGEGPEKKTIENEIKKLKLNNVILAGYINPSNIEFYHAFYERADVHISPSIWEEPFGLTIIEAMASTHGAVIATKKGGVSSIIEDGHNGLLISSRNSKQIADAVNRLLDDDVFRKKIGDNAYKTVIEKFTWKKIADQFEVLYKKFGYSTSEYLAVVKGASPKMAKFLQQLKRPKGN